MKIVATFWMKSGNVIRALEAVSHDVESIKESVLSSLRLDAGVMIGSTFVDMCECEGFSIRAVEGT